ncbi:hypothetical protein MK079_03605 [Candidatus Gracilibacteria bacterium]|nr:hypothetical protein [Candidatus Gracilibacteria bacterium]
MVPFSSTNSSEENSVGINDMSSHDLHQRAEKILANSGKKKYLPRGDINNLSSNELHENVEKILGNIE